VTIGVPDAVASRLRRFARRRGTRRADVPTADLAGAGLRDRTVHVDAEGRALRLASAPRVTVIRRNPQAAVDAFLAHAPPQVTADEPLAQAIGAERWYHTIELPAR
jgi:hypothetical protein